MQLEKEEIKQGIFSPEEQSLYSHFVNKRVEAFLREVENLRKKNGKLSQAAEDYSKHFKEIMQKAERAIEIIESPKQGWKINKIDKKSELAVQTKGTNISMRYEGLLEMNIENLCTVIYQVNNYDKWVPFCHQGKDIREVTPLQKLCYLSFKIPIISNRYAYFYGLGIDRIDENGTIIIYGEGITDKQNMMDRFGLKDEDKNKGMVLLDLKFFICEISYKSQNQYLFRVYLQLDSRMPMMPEWLVNTLIKKMGGFIFDSLIKLAGKFQGSPWEKSKMQDRDNPFYPWLSKRMKEWHRQQQVGKSQNSSTKMGTQSSKL